jgi:hypothetical protein
VAELSGMQWALGHKRPLRCEHRFPSSGVNCFPPLFSDGAEVFSDPHDESQLEIRVSFHKVDDIF